MSASPLHATLAKISPAPYDPFNMLKAKSQTISCWEEDNELTTSIWDSAGRKRKNEFVKQYVINESAEDLLALSVTWHRIRNNREVKATSPDITSLTDTALFGCVTEEDRVQANVIRDHYSKKLMMWALTEVKLTKFRTDLSTFIQSTGKLFTDELLPLVFRLPEFYEYDLEFTRMKSAFTTIPEGVQHTKSHVKLFPVKNLNRKLKSGYKHEYWLKDKDGNAYLILIDHLNILKSMWDREFNKEHILINALMTCKLKQDEQTYFKLSKWEVE